MDLISRIRLTPIEAVVCLLGIAGLGFSLFAISLGFQNSIFDFHGFRQAQTAITADSILHGGAFLRYETPVFGPPWSLPFEFPLYQGVVAALTNAFPIPLDQSGRLVSILFYYLCFFPLASILSRVGFRGTQMIPSLVLFAVSPIYIFVSRIFMIESTALFFSLLYADQAVGLVLGSPRWRTRNILAATAFGLSAGLVKVTTFAPFFIFGASLALWGLWRDYKGAKLRGKIAVEVTLLCISLPVIATWQWTKFADKLKVQNPFGVYLTSKALHAWNFGTVALRLHPRIYLQFLRAANNYVGSVWCALIVLIVYVALCRRWNLVAAACVTLYIGTILVFFNLHLVHEYYSYSIAVLLLIAIGVLISAILKVPGQRAWLGVALLTFQMAACGYRYFSHYYPLQRKNAPGRFQAAALIDRITKPQDVILILGLDWSAELPYQSHRRAIMDATFVRDSDSWGMEPVRRAVANQGPQNVAALVACDKGRDGMRLSKLLQDVGMSHAAAMHADDCDVYARTP